MERTSDFHMVSMHSRHLQDYDELGGRRRGRQDGRDWTCMPVEEMVQMQMQREAMVDEHVMLWDS